VLHAAGKENMKKREEAGRYGSGGKKGGVKNVIEKAAAGCRR